jgi:hypothetical protein
LSDKRRDASDIGPAYKYEQSLGVAKSLVMYQQAAFTNSAKTDIDRCYYQVLSSPLSDLLLQEQSLGPGEGRTRKSST